MPKYGKVKICKARRSTKNKTRCGTHFVTKPGPHQKFCSEKCRVSNYRVLRSEELKKAKRLKEKISNTEKKSKSTSDLIKRLLSEITNHEKEIADFKNEERPKVKSKEWTKMTFQQRRLLEEIQSEYDRKKILFKRREPVLKNLIESKIKGIINALNIIKDDRRMVTDNDKEVAKNKAIKIARDIKLNYTNRKLLQQINSFTIQVEVIEWTAKNEFKQIRR